MVHKRSFCQALIFKQYKIEIFSLKRKFDEGIAFLTMYADVFVVVSIKVSAQKTMKSNLPVKIKISILAQIR
jgi:hypothetical protein